MSDYLRGVPKPSELLNPETAAAAAALLARPPEQTLDPDVKKAVIAAQQAAQEAVIGQLDEWITLARFAKRLSIGLAIGSGLLSLFLLSAMTWNDLFAGSGLWEFSLLLFALAVFVASPLAIFVIGRPLKGVDEWSPGLPTNSASSGTRAYAAWSQSSPGDRWASSPPVALTKVTGVGEETTGSVRLPGDRDPSPGPFFDDARWAAHHHRVRRVLLALAVVAVVAGGFGAGYYVGSHADDTRVPNMLGLGTEDGGQAAARRELAAAGLRVGKVGWMLCAPDENGLVVRQNPPAGTVVPKGATVNIAIGDDGTHLIGIFGTPEPCLPGEQQPAGLPPTETRSEVVAVPDVTGLSPVSASRLIEEAGLIAEAVELPAAHGQESVAAQQPLPGSLAEPGSTVVIYVS